MGLMAIFHTLLTEEHHQTKHLCFFYILSTEEIDKLGDNVRRYNGRERV